MTKITHKEYVDTIIDKASIELRKIKKKMEEQYKLCDVSVETDRVWERMIKEFSVSLQPELSDFVLNKGIPRKQRVSSTSP